MTTEILKDEMLSAEQLDQVAGGTIAELKELVNAMQSNPVVKGFGKVCSHIPVVNEGLKLGVFKDLREIGILADIDTGWFCTGAWSDKNRYWDINTKKSLTHAQVLERIRAYKG